MEKTCNLVELFSGIGSQAKALKNLGINVKIQGTCEWDIHAIAAYDVIHNENPTIPEDIEEMTKEQLLETLKNYTFSNTGKAPLSFDSLRTYSKDSLKRIYTSVRRNKNYVDVTTLGGASLPDGIDIMTYSFPCQDLSNVGAFHGYNKGIDKDSGSRSSLLWQVGRILTEMKDMGKSLPRFLLLENVPTLLSKRHFGNFQTWINDLEKLGYLSHYYQLNATSFGLPQNRPRLLMVSVYVGDDVGKWRVVRSYFEQKQDPEHIIDDYRKTDFFHQYEVKDLLRINYWNKKIKAEAEASTPNDTVSRRKIWDDNPQIVLPDGTINPAIDAIRTITTKQDRNPNSGNVYYISDDPGKSTFRYLTPRECLLFMGFTDEDFKSLRSNNVEFHKDDWIFARDKIIRMAGNSIPVKMLEGIFLQIQQIDKRLEEYSKNKNDNADEVKEDYAAIIRTYVANHGMRSRLHKETTYPSNATRIYPKYRTAIYIRECCAASCGVDESGCDLCHEGYWRKRCDVIVEAEKQRYQEALNMGWNAVIVKPYELNAARREETLAWIVQCIKEGLSGENQGRVYSRG